MPLKAVIKGEVPEGLGDYYKPKEGEQGVFVLDVEPVGGLSLEDVSGLKTALSTERTKAAEAERTAKAFEGLNPKTVREKLTRLEELEQIDPNKEADRIAHAKVDAAVKQLNEKHEQELTERDARITRYRDRVYDQEIRVAAIEAITSEKGVPDLLLPHVMSSTRLRETDDGKFLVEVVDKEKNVRIGDSKGTPMTIAGLVKEMKENEIFSRAFEPSGGNGSGGGGNNGSGGGGVLGHKKAAEMSIPEKSKFITEHGSDAWIKKVNDEASAGKA